MLKMKKLIIPFAVVFIIFLGFILCDVKAQAQVCDTSAIMNIKGEWKTSSDNIVSPDKSFPASQYNQVRTRLDKIAMLFKEAYPEPKGMQATWWRAINNNSLVDKGPLPYQFESLYKWWYCNQYLHKLMLGDETGTWSFVYVNSFGWFMTHQYDELADKIDGSIAFLLPKKIGEWKGLPLYEPSGSSQKNKAILITRDGQLPYKPVSRLQFLNAMKQKLEASKKIQLEVDNKMVERTEAEQAIAKQKGLENALFGATANRIEDRKATYMKRYRTDRQLKEEKIQQTENYYDGLFKPYNNILQNSNENELKEPAIVDGVSWTSLFKGFTSQDNGGRMVVFINNDYFNLKLPRYVPQFIALYWEWDKNSAAQNFKKQLEENFPIDKLRAMIDK